MNLMQKNCIIFGGGIFVIALFACLMVKLQSAEDVLSFLIILVPISFISVLLAVMKIEQEEDERERAGLRRRWKAEDLDGLEERIRKLEEEK